MYHAYIMKRSVALYHLADVFLFPLQCEWDVWVIVVVL